MTKPMPEASPEIIQQLRRMALEKAPIAEMIRTVLRETGLDPEHSSIVMIKAFKDAFALPLRYAVEVAASPILGPNSLWTEKMLQESLWPRILETKDRWSSLIAT